MPNGKIRLVSRYNRNMIRRNPTTLFVFGDNFKRVGYGGQAAEARGEPNSVGIVTKLSPDTFLLDSMHELVQPAIVTAFTRLANQLVAGNDVVWPADGVGTGLARLPEMAPGIHEGIELCRLFLFTLGSQVLTEPY
jgi:hypothetical protein